MIEKIIHKAGISALLAAAFLLGSCADDHDPDGGLSENGGTAEVTFSLSSRYNGAQTRADGTPIDQVLDNEKIKDWFLVFTDKTGTVRKILNRREAVDTPPEVVEEETFTCTLPTGTYSVYAFANITPEQLTAATASATAPGLTFAVDNTLTLQTMENALWHGLNNTDGKKTTPAESITQLGTIYDANVTEVSTNNLNLWNIESAIGAIPMTGYLGNVKVENTIEEKFSIEVVRMTAKIEIRFINPGENPAVIKQLSISPITSSAVSLFPKNATESGIGYAHLGNFAYKPLGNPEYAVLNYPLGDEGKSIDANPNNSEELIKQSNVVFYAKESLSDNEGPFTISLKMQYGNNSEETLTYKTNTIKGYINRNDWVVIPVKLSQYVVKTVGDFYPPIGGYPAMKYTVESDGTEVYTLGTQGEFSITPEVIDQLSGYAMARGRYEFTLNVTEGANIFTTQPTLDKYPNEIYGVAGTATGTATLVLTIEVYEKETHAEGEAPKKTFTHNIKIVRQN